MGVYPTRKKLRNKGVKNMEKITRKKCEDLATKISKKININIEIGERTSYTYGKYLLFDSSKGYYGTSDFQKKNFKTWNEIFLYLQGMERLHTLQLLKKECEEK